MTTPATTCKAGHDRTAPNATYRDGGCRACKAIYNATYNPVPPSAMQLDPRTFRALNREATGQPVLERLEIALRFWQAVAQ